MTATLETENWQKVGQVEPVYLGKYPYCKKQYFVVLNTLFTDFCVQFFLLFFFFMFMLLYSDLDTIFPFSLFFLFFLLLLSTFKPQNADRSEFDLLQIFKSTIARLKPALRLKF